MTKFQLETSQLSHEIWQETLSTKLFSSLHLHPNHPIIVKLKHRIKELYTVVAPIDKTETRVAETLNLLGERVVPFNTRDCNNHIYSGMIFAALVDIGVNLAAAKDWDALLEYVTESVHEGVCDGYDKDGDRVMGISVEFVSTFLYRCFKEVDENC